MSWKSPLLVFLGVLMTRCQAEKPCVAVMWIEPRAVLVGGSIEVFCRCIGSTVVAQDLSIVNWLNYSVATQPVDKFTIKYRREKVNMNFHVDWHCRYQETEVGRIEVYIVPLIHVKQLQCRVHPNASEVTCYFNQAGLPAWGGEKSYFLSVNQMARVQCLRKSSDTTFQCQGIPFNETTKQYHLKLDMECQGYSQTKEFHLDFKQVQAPEWPKNKMLIFEQHGIHVVWSYDFYSNQDLEWRVWYLPRNPKIQKHLIQRKIKKVSNSLSIGRYIIESPSYAYQSYRLRISRRYPLWDSPWSTEIESPDFVTPATLPNRPPELLPNGFFYDPKKRDLYVYWRQLDELELNGPNFTYNVLTDRGKSAMILSNNSALFRYWDAEKPATVGTWSKNSKGRSINSNELQVPILTNSLRYQPRDLWYHEDNQTITWQPPMELDKLIGYTISWCSVSINSLQICDDHELIQFKVLDGSQNWLQFNGSMVLPNVAVAANYIGSASGGMQWITPRRNGRENIEKSSGLTQYIAPTVIVVLVGPIYFLFRKLKRMAQIEVIVPDILFKCDRKAGGLSRCSDPPDETVVPGNFSPKAVMNITNIPAGTYEKHVIRLDYVQSGTYTESKL
ncbi:cytokine receptor-like [Drosophila rhopaloa]|uniref:Cytokine receptor-like n=1 Tax=Drosophila rhopaloa TaxID=1041015 RepID=A0A6P4FGH9_DRORH|nr:cytokine receptor-like [Drosophila rhopaloa]